MFVICIIVKYQQKTIKNMSDENIDKERDSKEKKYSTTKMVLGIIMIAIYLGMAYALLFTKFFEVTIQYEWMRYVWEEYHNRLVSFWIDHKNGKYGVYFDNLLHNADE